jgi:hypothetical protein
LLVGSCWPDSGEVAVKKIFLLVFVVLMGFIVLNRQRVYVRDPLATVYRNQVKQSGVQVYINYSNDVLLWRDAEPGGYRILVQGWNKMPGTPAVLKCVRWMACMAEADRTPTTPIDRAGMGAYDPRVTMTNREVSFMDGDGAQVRVQLR